jgi:hypothetical protein
MGALGFRKFPNPRFDREAWINIKKRPGIWEAYRQRLDDGSIEPPFLIGMVCGACHITLDPLKPPKDPAHLQWENLSGTVGNQYSRVSQIFASGMPEDSLEWQVFAYARPGVVDTSAIPTDSINNPGTMNAIINLLARPPFEETVTKWRKTEACLIPPIQTPVGVNFLINVGNEVRNRNWSPIFLKAGKIVLVFKKRYNVCTLISAVVPKRPGSTISRIPSNLILINETLDRPHSGSDKTDVIVLIFGLLKIDFRIWKIFF